MGKFKYIVLLSLIVLMAFALRMWQISNVPPGLSNDEIAIAFESYSIANTARDSSGRFLPISFKVNEDSRAPLYVYIVAPFIKIFGNNEIAIRFPSALFGTLTVISIYFLVKKLGYGEIGGLISSFLLAITPWHIYTSRIGFEPNIALFFLVCGTLFFLVGIEKKKFLFLSPLFFALSIYAYYTEWIFTPLILVSLTLIFFRKLKIKDIAICWFIFLLVITPIVLNSVFFGGGARASNEIILNDFLLANKLAGVGNFFFRGFIIFSFWLDKYLRYIGFDYIFGHGLPISAPYGSSDFGLLNIVQFPLLLIGIYFLITSKNRNSSFLLLSWSLLGPLVPSLTEGDLNLGRNLISVIPLTVICSCGLVWILQKRLLKPIGYILVAALLVNLLFFYRYYINYFPLYYSENWSYGFKQIALYIKENEQKYEKIVIDYQYGTQVDLYGVPSAFVFYFNKINPTYFIQESKSNENGLFVGKYEFRRMDWPKEAINPNSLYVVGVRSDPVAGQKVREIFSINLLNGKKAFKMYESY